MGPELILGFDLTPSDPQRLVVLSDALRKVIGTLVQFRAELERIGGTGSVWDGPVGAPIAALLRRFSPDVGAGGVAGRLSASRGQLARGR